MTRAAVLLLALAAPASCAYLDDWGLGGWTDRLGLSFSDDCQENSGLAALFAWAESWLSGRGGQQRSAHCETKESACPAGVAVTGLQVKGGHVKKSGNRELYDFRLRCGSGWQHGWLGLRFDVRGGRESERGAGVCPEGSDLTGVQVMRGRSAGPNSRDCARPLPTERMHANDMPARCLEPRRSPARMWLGANWIVLCPPHLCPHRLYFQAALRQTVARPDRPAV